MPRDRKSFRREFKALTPPVATGYCEATGRLRYSITQARVAARWMHSQGHYVHPYQCGQCHAYHVGHA